VLRGVQPDTRPLLCDQPCQIPAGRPATVPRPRRRLQIAAASAIRDENGISDDIAGICTEWVRPFASGPKREGPDGIVSGIHDHSHRKRTAFAGHPAHELAVQRRQ